MSSIARLQVYDSGDDILLAERRVRSRSESCGLNQSGSFPREGLGFRGLVSSTGYELSNSRTIWALLQSHRHRWHARMHCGGGARRGGAGRARAIMASLLSLCTLFSLPAVLCALQPPPPAAAQTETLSLRASSAAPAVPRSAPWTVDPA
jgi:hypothetical protein